MTIQVTVSCSSCGKELSVFKNEELSEALDLEVPPCSDCTESARDEGYDRGYMDGQEIEV